MPCGSHTLPGWRGYNQGVRGIAPPDWRAAKDLARSGQRLPEHMLLERLKGRRERSHGMRPGASRRLLHPTCSGEFLAGVGLAGRMRVHACLPLK